MKTESLLIEILESVLGVRALTQESRFLDVGGNSLNLVQVLNQIHERTGIALSPRLFFDRSQSTVAALSAAIDSSLAETHLTV